MIDNTGVESEPRTTTTLKDKGKDVEPGLIEFVFLCLLKLGKFLKVV